MGTAVQRDLTPKGRATRDRIVEATAELIKVYGVHDTNNELMREAAGISGSQLNHYFPTKESLVRAVIVWRVDSMLGLRQRPPRGPLNSIAALREWADGYLSRGDAIIESGCTFGSLVSEVMKSDLDVHDEIAAGFERWKDQFRSGLRAMQDDGKLRDDADVEQLAHVLMAAFQGGMLLTQATRDVGPLRDALYGAIELVEFHTNARSKARR